MPLTFLGKFRGTEDQEHHLHESPSAMTIPLIVLAILAVVGGFLGIPEVMCKRCASGWNHFLGPVFDKGGSGHIDIPASTEWMLMGVSTVLALLMVFYGWNKFSRNPELGEPVGLGKGCGINGMWMKSMMR